MRSFKKKAVNYHIYRFFYYKKHKNLTFMSLPNKIRCGIIKLGMYQVKLKGKDDTK